MYPVSKTRFPAGHRAYAASSCSKRREPRVGKDISNKGDQLSLYWRRDPHTSLSDWKIVVQIEKGNGVNGSRDPSREYNVHRTTLAFGSRRCGYFTTLFHPRQNQSFAESQDKTTTLELPRPAFDVFDKFLDYVYGGDPLHCIDSETAVALSYLADRFDNSTLQEAVIMFVGQDLESLMERMPL